MSNSFLLLTEPCRIDETWTEPRGTAMQVLVLATHQADGRDARAVVHPVVQKPHRHPLGLRRRAPLPSLHRCGVTEMRDGESGPIHTVELIVSELLLAPSTPIGFTALTSNVRSTAGIV